MAQGQPTKVKKKKKSVLKRAAQARQRAEVNRANRTRVRTLMRRLRTAISAGGGRVAGRDRGAQAAHQSAYPGPVGAIDLSALTSLRRALQNRLFLLLNFGRLSLGHLLLLLRFAQISNVKRGSGALSNELSGRSWAT